jgi:hypothetical protein
MKKLYFLNEEEKNRILNLHENATKRQYLPEQEEVAPQKNGNAIDDVNNAINAVKNPGSQPETFGFPTDPNAAAGIKSAQDMLKNFNFGNFGGTGTPAGTTTTAPAGTTTTAPAGTTTTAPAGTTTTAPAATTTTAPTTWSPDPTGNKAWEYQFKDGKWSARKIGQTKEYVISDNPKYASSVTKLNTAYPDAIKPVSTATPTNTTPVNTVVGGDASSEAIKKTAEANASTGVAANTTPASPAQNTPKAASGTVEVDSSEFS